MAYHAALPLALTPDLLYRIWANFRRDIQDEFIDIPWIAVSDLILSSLCDEVGHELYEMDATVRQELLKISCKAISIHRATPRGSGEFFIAVCETRFRQSR